MVVNTTADTTTQLGARDDILDPLAQLIEEARPNGDDPIGVGNEVTDLKQRSLVMVSTLLGLKILTSLSVMHKS